MESGLAFSPEQSAQVIALAARMQEADAEKIPVAQLRQAALEAGIEDRYIEAAIQQVGDGQASIVESETPEASDNSPSTFGLVLLNVCVLAKFGMDYRLTSTAEVPMAAAAVMLLVNGILLPSRKALGALGVIAWGWSAGIYLSRSDDFGSILLCMAIGYLIYTAGKGLSPYRESK